MLALTRQMAAGIFDSRLISSPDPSWTTALAVKGKYFFLYIPAIEPEKTSVYLVKNMTYH